MPSLLDLAIMRANPLSEGLLGIGGRQPEPLTPGVVSPLAQPGPFAGAVPPPGPEAVTTGPVAQGEGSFLQRLFAGGNDPNLSPEENERIGKQARLFAGLRILASEKTGIGAVAEGILTGQQVSQLEKDKAIAAAEKKAKMLARTDILNGLDLTDPQSQAGAVRDLLAAGDMDAAKEVADFVFSVPQAAVLKPIDAGDRIELIKPITGETVRVITKEDERGGFVQADTGDQILLLDKNNGQTIRAIPKLIDRSGEGKDRFDRANFLADDFRSETSRFRSIAQAITSGQNTPPNAAGDLTLIQSHVRAADPGASVRESDIRNEEAIGGYPARTQAFILRFQDGTMDPDTRELIRADLIRIGVENRGAIQPVIERFTARSLDAGVNPDFVVFDMFGDIGVGLPEGFTDDGDDPIASFGGN